jgi:hypothetical protein
MTDDPKRSRQTKSSKSSRKNRRNSRRSNTSNHIYPQLPPRTDISFEQTSNNIENDFLKVIIDDFTSDIDDPHPRVPSTSSIISTTNYDVNTRRKPIGEQRRDQLTKQMKNLYQDWFEFGQSSNLHDSLNNPDKRKQYSTNLW